MSTRNGASDISNPLPIKKRCVEEDSPFVYQLLLDFIRNSTVDDVTNRLLRMEKQTEILEILENKRLQAAFEEKIGPITNFALAHLDWPAWLSYVADTMDINKVISDPKVSPDVLLNYLLKKSEVSIMHVRQLFDRGLDIKNNPLFADILFRDAVVDNPVLADLLIKNGADIFKVVVDASKNVDTCAFAAFRRGAWVTLLTILNVAAVEATKKDGRRFVVEMKRKNSDKVDEVMIVDWLLEKRVKDATDVVFASEYFKKIQMTYKPATIFHAPDSDYGILHKWILRGDPYFLEIFMQKNRPLLEKELKFDFSSKNKGYTALHIAACYPDDAQILTLVLELMASCRDVSQDVDVPGPPPHKFTPLYLAAMNGKAKMVRVLLDKGANVACIPESKTAYPPILNIATINGHVEVVDAILGTYSPATCPLSAIYMRDVNGFFPLDYIYFVAPDDPKYGTIKEKLETFLKKRSKDAFDEKKWLMHSASELARTKWTEPFGVMKTEIAEAAATFHPDVGTLRPAVIVKSSNSVPSPAQAVKSTATAQPVKPAATAQRLKPTSPVQPLRSVVKSSLDNPPLGK